MRKGMRSLIYTLVVGAIFFAGVPELSAQKLEGFKSYQLLVFCESTSLVTAVYWYNVPGNGPPGRPYMGLYTACAGKCRGVDVSIAEALADLPAGAKSAIEAMVAADEAQGKSPACLKDPQQTSGVPPSASPSPEQKPCKAGNVTLEVSRDSLVQTYSRGDPQPGANPAFKYTAGSGATYTTADANANPNTGDLKASQDAGSSGEPSPGSLVEMSVAYTCEGGESLTKKFSVAVFGLSCYVLADENDWLLPNPPPPTPMPSPSASPSPTGSPAPAPDESPSPTPTPAPTIRCKSQRIGSTRYTGVTTDPTGLPEGEYCTAFLADVRLQGSGTTKDGTKIAYVSGNNPNWRFKTITDFTGADSKPLVENGSVARDRAFVGGNGNTTVTLETGSFLANDTGGAIRGYRLDVFGGTGQKACKAFKNRMEFGTCDPGTTTCPALKSPVP